MPLNLETTPTLDPGASTEVRSAADAWTHPVARWGLVVLAAATLLVVPAIQHVSEIQAGLTGRRTSVAPGAYRVFVSWPSGKNLAAYAETMERQSVAAEAVRGPVRRLTLRWLARARPGVVVASTPTEVNGGGLLDGRTLFDGADVDHVVGPGFVINQAGVEAAPDRGGGVTSVEAIVHLARQLQRRRIALIVVPTPVKPTLDSALLTRAKTTPPARNVGFSLWLQSLRAAGVRVHDPAPALASQSPRDSRRCLRSDRYWLPQTMDAAANALAAAAMEAAFLPDDRTYIYQRRLREVTHLGESWDRLGLGLAAHQRPVESVLIQRVYTTGDIPWTADDRGDVLLLGDGFATVYHDPALGWGADAGLGAQLSYHLRRPVDQIVVADDRPLAALHRLRDQLLTGDDRLLGKRLVILQFDARQLSTGVWQKIDLPTAREVAEIKRRRDAASVIVPESN